MTYMSMECHEHSATEIYPENAACLAEELRGGPAAAEAESRLLDLNRRILATAASHSTHLSDGSWQANKGLASESFSWDQV